MVFQDLTNIGPLRGVKRLRQQIRDLYEEIRSEEALLWRSRLQVEKRRLLLQIRHTQYIHEQRHAEFVSKQQQLVRAHLVKKAEFVSVRKSDLIRQRESYRKRVERLREESKRRNVQGAVDGRQSIQVVSKKLSEANQRSLWLLREQLQDSQAVVLNTIRRLRSQVEDAVLQNARSEESIGALHQERRRIVQLRDDAQKRFREAARQLIDLRSESVPAMLNIVQRFLQKSNDSAKRSQKRLRRRRLQLNQLQKQLRIFRHGLGRAIAERDDLYEHFKIVIETLREKNSRLENDTNERLRHLSQSLTVKSESTS